MVFSATGNLTVLSILAQRKVRASSRINIMLAHLAIADLLVGLALEAYRTCGDVWEDQFFNTHSSTAP